MNKNVFEDFADYWSYAKPFSNKQRRVILNSLPESQRNMLKRSYRKDGWHDRFVRNSLDRICDEIKSEYGLDLLRIRVLVFNGKDVFVKRSFWEQILSKFRGVAERHTAYIFGGFRATESEFASDEFRLVRNGGLK